MFRNQVLIAATAVFSSLAAMLAPLPLPVAAFSPQTHAIQVHARQFAYEPAVLSVQRGDTINLHFESLDAAHGLFIDGYDIELQAEPGQGADITFIADQPGKFKIRCSVSCGVLHPFMMGELTVEPNSPFWLATAAMLIATLGAWVYFRHDAISV